MTIPSNPAISAAEAYYAFGDGLNNPVTYNGNPEWNVPAQFFLRPATKSTLVATALNIDLTPKEMTLASPDGGTSDGRNLEATSLDVVTASPTIVVRPFAEILGADELIGTELAYDDEDRVTGAFATPNCRGPEKVVRLEARFGPGLRLEAAYGDTAGDREMLAIAENPGYRVFTARPGPTAKG